MTDTSLGVAGVALMRKWFDSEGRSNLVEAVLITVIICILVYLFWWLTEPYEVVSPDDGYPPICITPDSYGRYLDPFGLSHPDFPDWVELDKGGMPVLGDLDTIVETPQLSPQYVVPGYFQQPLKYLEDPIEIPARPLPYCGPGSVGVYNRPGVKDGPHNIVAEVPIVGSIWLILIGFLTWKMTK